MNFSLIYSLIFGLISALAGFLFITDSHGEGWEYLGVSTGIAGFLTAFLLSKLLIVKRNKYDGSTLVVTGLITGILSHWVHWYQSLVANYINVKLFGAYMFGDPTHPVDALLAAVQLSLMSLLIFGWTAIPLAIGALFLTKRITKIK